MAKEIREIIAHQEEELKSRRGYDRERELKLDVLRLLGIEVCYAENIGALPSSLPQFSRATELDQARTETTEPLVTDKERLMAGLGLTSEQVACHPNEVNDKTKAYLGALLNFNDRHVMVPVFKKIGHLDHIYTDYPEGWVPVWNRVIGGKKPTELEDVLDRAEIYVGSLARSMMMSHEFTTLDKPETVRLVMLSVFDMGFQTGATTAQIIGTENDVDELGNPAPFNKGRMTELGLELCLPELAIYQRIADHNQEVNASYCIAMKPITDSSGFPNFFRLVRQGGLWLRTNLAQPYHLWNPEDQLVFSHRK